MGQGPGDQAQRPSPAAGRADSLFLPLWCVAASPGEMPAGSLGLPVLSLEAGPRGVADPCVADLGLQPM